MGWGSRKHCFCLCQHTGSTHTQIFPVTVYLVQADLASLPSFHAGLVPLFFAQSTFFCFFFFFLGSSWLFPCSLPDSQISSICSLSEFYTSLVSLILQSIPKSSKNQVNEKNIQSFGSTKKQLNASFKRARGHLNFKCWKSYWNLRQNSGRSTWRMIR